MIFDTIVTEGLAHLSYVVGDDHSGVCVVIDPRRDIGVYLAIAQRHNAQIVRILETHIHADFVSGSRNLAAKTGAPPFLSADGGYEFPHEKLGAGDRVSIGDLTFEVLRTPGHTPEHVAFVVSGGHKAEERWGIFTGDTLFAGEVGRPDLLGEEMRVRLAHDLFHSLQALLQLGDELEVYPAHGQGSPCGAQIGARRMTTIGYEKLYNPKLQIQDENEFCKTVLADLQPAPAYYTRMKHVNAQAEACSAEVTTPAPLDAQSFAAEMATPNTIVIDTREIEAFGGAHIPNSLNIPLRQEFPIWAGWMLEPDQRILLVVSEQNDVELASYHMARVGLDNVIGFLRRGFRDWTEAGLIFHKLPQMSVHELNATLETAPDTQQLLDVRREDEWRQGHIRGALHIPASDLSARLDELDRAVPVAVYCSTGYRAGIAASVLKRSGCGAVFNVPGSIVAWKAAGFEVEGSQPQ